MALFTRAQYEKLYSNGSFKCLDKDPQPVVKLHMEGINCIWLLTELDPDNPFTAFGLVDLGLRSPELGYIDLRKIYGTRLPLGITLERDEDFIGLYPLSVYARAVKACGCITEDQDILRCHQVLMRPFSLYPI